MNEAILATIASLQMGTNSMLREFDIRVIAVVQDHELYVAKDILNRVIVRTAFGQADPVQLQVAHDLTGVPRFTWVGAVLVKGNPNGGVRIPMPEVT
jgi:hypothetical protein